MTVTVSLPVFVMYAKGAALAMPAPKPAASETTRAKTTETGRRREARSGTADDHCSDGAGGRAGWAFGTPSSYVVTGVPLYRHSGGLLDGPIGFPKAHPSLPPGERAVRVRTETLPSRGRLARNHERELATDRGRGQPL